MTSMSQVKSAIVNLLERGGFTFLEVFIGFYAFAGVSLGDPGVAVVAATAGVAAVLALVKTFATQMLGIKVSKNPAVDLGWRAGFTYLQGFAGLMVVSANSNSLSIAATHAALVAAAPAVAAVIKGALAGFITGSGTPAAVPAAAEQYALAA